MQYLTPTEYRLLEQRVRVTTEWRREAVQQALDAVYTDLEAHGSRAGRKEWKRLERAVREAERRGDGLNEVVRLFIEMRGAGGPAVVAELMEGEMFEWKGAVA